MKESFTVEGEKKGRQPIHDTYYNGHLEVAKWLAEQEEVSLLSIDHKGKSVITCACWGGQPKVAQVVKWLVELEGMVCR